MIGTQKTIIVNDVYNMMKQGRLKVPSYQRNYVWSTKQQALLIDSILNGRYIGQMLLAKSEGPDYYEIIDGQQRIKTIYFFIKNGFKVKKDDQALDEKTKQEFLNHPLHFYIIDEVLATEQIVDIFKLINTSGEPLAEQELRHAEKKNIFSDAVSSLAEGIFPNRNSFSNSQDLEECFVDSLWNRLGVLTKQQLLKMQDEELIARIILSVMFDRRLHPSDDLLNDAYGKTGSDSFKLIETKFSNKIIKDIEYVFCLLEATTFKVECPSKEGFYIIFMALYDVIIVEQKNIPSPDLLIDVFININSITSDNERCQYASLDKYAKYLILQYCFDSEDSEKIGLLKRILTDSTVETARYEFKQGFLRLSDDRKRDKEIKNQIVETICGMANAKFMEPAYLLIGIADKESDAKRINQLDSIAPIKIGDHYIVGIDREAEVMKISIDKYFAQIKDIIDNSNLSDALKLSVLANVDVITYHGFSVVVIMIPPQREVSFVGDSVFIRKCSSTIEVRNSREIIALNNRFLQ